LKHLGVLGHSAEGAALCFREFCQQAGGRLGEHEHPDVTLDCISFARCMPAYDSGDYASVREVMETSLSRLSAAGADFFVCPDNTVHLALEQPGTEFPMPGLHIAQVVADRAAADGRARVGVLGTRYTMDGPIYPRALAARAIGAQVPDEADRETVNAVIFDELVKGTITDESRREFVRIIERLAARGCDAVALVCTEIPLLVADDDSPLPVLDSTRLLAAAALEVAIGDRPLPQWRGGPLTDGSFPI
jgi:aspartate racemase